jgi:competence protein ComEC
MTGGPSYLFWQTPAAPVALAATAGVVADRCWDVPLPLWLVSAAACVVAWAIVSMGRQKGLAVIYLWGGVAAVGAAYHHWYRNPTAADDIGQYAPAEPQPVVLRGVLAEEPITPPEAEPDPLQGLLRSQPRPTATFGVLCAAAIKRRDEWLPASGRVRLTIDGARKDLHIGDEVEVVGLLQAPPNPSNPGERSYADFLRDRQIGALLHVRKTPEGVTYRDSHWSISGVLEQIRGAAHSTLEDYLPKHLQGLAMALLLGENWMLDKDSWDRYQRTGVIHVIAISGQHLAVLAAFLWVVLRVLRVRRRPGSLVVALFLLGYALMTGGRPPVMRSAVMACSVCGAVLLVRPLQIGNVFAAAWLIVAILNPTDIGDAGCQLSFASVAVLIWGVAWFVRRELDPLEKEIEDSRPQWQKSLRRLGGKLILAYGMTLAVWVALAPLIVERYNLVSFAGLVIGPPVVLLATVALLAGFFLLLFAQVLPPLAVPAAWITEWGLEGCEWIVNWAVGWPGSYWYVPDAAGWWVWAFYGALFAGLTIAFLRKRWRSLGLALLAWFVVGLATGAVRPRSDELRCTFLAVGHGGCAVLETADGRTILYDIGTLSGPEVTRKFVVPYLWSRGVRRIDEVFLSHAHLDHYNGLPALLERFAVRQVSWTPTFADSEVPGAHVTMAELKRRGVETRVVRAGDRLDAGDVSLHVLHPPLEGPKGKEDVRSMVLLVRHHGHSILLTGDLEVDGQRDLFARIAALPVDVLQAPHHGSRTANNATLAAWARPKVIVSCQAPPIWPSRGPDPYEAVGGQRLATWEHGAVTVRSSAEGLVVETFKTGKRWQWAAEAER